MSAYAPLRAISTYVPGPVEGARVSEAYARLIARDAYFADACFRNTHFLKSISDLRDDHQNESAACGEAYKLRKDVSEWILVRYLTNDGMLDLMSHGEPHTEKSPKIG